MTVCAAGICQGSDIIVTVSDRMAVWGHGGSDEPLLKAASLDPLWIAMIAGDDITRGIEDVIRDVRLTLKEQGDLHSAEQLRSAVIGAWRDNQNVRGAAVVLNAFRMTVADFMERGRDKFPPDMYAELLTRLQTESRLESRLLICGFNDHKVPWLFACDDDSPWHDFTRGGYVAVGSGASLTLTALTVQRYKRENNLYAAIYQLCAAKFAAESDPYVGRDTIVLCFRDDGKFCWITVR
jgi:hypothetical protein